MEIIFLLIPLALLFLAGAIAALFWALRKDQFDDLDNAAWRVVFEDREQRKQPRKKARKGTRETTTSTRQNTPSDSHDDH